MALNVDRTLIAERVARPAEALNVELKNWIDPTSPQGKAKIIRAAIALRNRNGGELVIGFNDKTLMPETTSMPANVEQAFQLDKIQGSWRSTPLTPSRSPSNSASATASNILWL